MVGGRIAVVPAECPRFRPRWQLGQLKPAAVHDVQRHPAGERHDRAEHDLLGGGPGARPERGVRDGLLLRPGAGVLHRAQHRDDPVRPDAAGSVVVRQQDSCDIPRAGQARGPSDRLVYR
uniref:(northern house mosquito) hypothetical protein n=1 Tax=Culex pipiens TaxID=7175 RepID=A0A8D8C7Q8_CULPI